MPSAPLQQSSIAGYRPDIDGLRAIAVGSVIGFHAFPGRISGGFVGVDIFFVISGFLISSIILKASATGNFSILDFYARRIRRIFPALITMVASCLLAGWVLLFPDELKQLGKHVLSASFFVLNFTLWSEAGYFDTASELKPLLHLWSLSIEEQFYTLWPITLLFFIRQGRPGLFISAATAVSFLLCVSGIFDKVANFYIPLARAWELLCGGLLAFIQTRPDLCNKIFQERLQLQRIFVEIFSLTGMVFLGLAIFALDNKIKFPGWSSLLPVLGTVMLIAAGPTTLINRYILGNRFFVFIGLISYPLYLWHWPLLSFPKITDGLELSIKTRLCAIALTAILATLTYIFIEKPLRHKGNKTSMALLLSTLLIAAAGYLLFAGVIHPKQADILAQKIAAAKHDDPFNSPTSNTYGIFIDEQEYRGIGHGKKTTLYIGDSNMDQHWQGVETLINAGDGTRKALLGGCRIPILHTNTSIPDDLDCRAVNAKVFAMAANDPDIDTIALGAQWRGAFSFQYVGGDQAYPMDTTEGMQKAMDQLTETIKDLTSRGKTVYVLLNVPGGEEFEPHNLIKRSLSGFQTAIHLEGGISLEEHRKRTQTISPLLSEAAKRGGAIVLDPADFMCADNWCNAVTADGEVIYRDIDHLKGSYSHDYPQFIGQTLK